MKTYNNGVGIFTLCRLLKEWPNTYAMTKAIAEGEIIIHGKGLPIGVVRPSMSEYTQYTKRKQFRFFARTWRLIFGDKVSKKKKIQFIYIYETE